MRRWMALVVRLDQTRRHLQVLVGPRLSWPDVGVVGDEIGGRLGAERMSV